MAIAGILAVVVWASANPAPTAEPGATPWTDVANASGSSSANPTVSGTPWLGPTPSTDPVSSGGLPSPTPPSGPLWPTSPATAEPPAEPTSPPPDLPTSTPKANPTAGPTAPAPGGGSPVLIGAGDICITSSIDHAQATAALIAANPRAVVFTAGDNSNESGTATQYADCVAKSWGAFKSRIHPVPGNHDYMTAGAAPFYAYFGAAAGAPGRGYYSYNLANNWHVIGLNALCSNVGGCGAGSPQSAFLQADLAANAGKHIIAIWHIPAFSSGSAHGNNGSYATWWSYLYAAHADIVIDGHDHDYERFALQSPAGKADPEGIREFVVGTGGAGQRPFGRVRANSQLRSTGTFGVLKLTLGAHSYSWQFIPVAGKAFSDYGVQATHS
jgi:acid phosphatase type 7